MHDRQQCIRIGSELSGLCKSTHGVPQGSILGLALELRPVVSAKDLGVYMKRYIEF